MHNWEFISVTGAMTITSAYRNKFIHRTTCSRLVSATHGWVLLVESVTSSTWAELSASAGAAVSWVGLLLLPSRCFWTSRSSWIRFKVSAWA